MKVSCSTQYYNNKWWLLIYHLCTRVLVLKFLWLYKILLVIFSLNPCYIHNCRKENKIFTHLVIQYPPLLWNDLTMFQLSFRIDIQVWNFYYVLTLIYKYLWWKSYRTITEKFRIFRKNRKKYFDFENGCYSWRLKLCQNFRHLDTWKFLAKFSGLVCFCSSESSFFELENDFIFLDRKSWVSHFPFHYTYIFFEFIERYNAFIWVVVSWRLGNCSYKRKPNQDWTANVKGFLNLGKS